MPYMKKIVVNIFLIFNLLNLYSQDRRVITTAVPFLMISADARASGLGEQGVATSLMLSLNIGILLNMFFWIINLVLA
jgi:hypothetical protein